MYIGIVYTYLPFMVLPLYARLTRLDPTLLEAAGDLGAPPWRAFLAVTLPLSLPGVWAGALLVFIPAVGEYVIPELLGGPQAQLIGRVLWNEFFANRDWPTASALACMLLVLLLIVPATVLQSSAGITRSAMTEGVFVPSRLVVTTAPCAHTSADRLADRLLRVPLRADRIPGRAQLQRLEPRHCLGRLFHPLVHRSRA